MNMSMEDKHKSVFGDKGQGDHLINAKKRKMNSVNVRHISLTF
jgi:hypothetical protein